MSIPMSMIKALILKEIKNVLNEVDGESWPPEGESSIDMSRSIPGEPQQQTKGEFLSVTPNLPVVAKCPATSQAYVDIKLAKEFGIDPNTPICFVGGIDGKPIAIVGDPAKVKVSAKKRGLFDIGSRGPKVKEIQTILATQGYDDELRGGTARGGRPGANTKMSQMTDIELKKFADGIFGKKTAASVKSFQKVKGIPQTGFIDQKTYEAIKKMGMGDNIHKAVPPMNESKNWTSNQKNKSSKLLFERLIKALSSD